jgi:hypothetical protein
MAHDIADRGADRNSACRDLVAQIGFGQHARGLSRLINHEEYRRVRSGHGLGCLADGQVARARDETRFDPREVFLVSPVTAGRTMARRGARFDRLKTEASRA